MRYEVGQVVFLLNSTDLKIIPVRIDEETIRRRSTGEEINYKLMLPTKSRDIVNLSDLEVEIFTSTADLRKYMIENAVRMIDSLIERSERVARVFSKGIEEDMREEEDVVQS